MVNPRSMSFRWFLLAAFFVVTVIGVGWPRLPYKTEVVDVCPISGSVSREIVTFGVFRERRIESTPLEAWIRAREPGFIPNYESWCIYRTYLFSVRRSCTKGPTVASLRSVQEPLLTQIAEERIADLVETLRQGDRVVQQQLVDALLDEIKP